jgi:hypothetical protein
MDKPVILITGALTGHFLDVDGGHTAKRGRPCLR